MSNLTPEDKLLLETVLKNHRTKIDPRINRDLHYILNGTVDKDLDTPVSFLATGHEGLTLTGLVAVTSNIYTGNMTVRQLLDYIPNDQLSYFQNSTFRNS